VGGTSCIGSAYLGQECVQPALRLRGREPVRPERHQAFPHGAWESPNARRRQAVHGRRPRPGHAIRRGQTLQRRLIPTDVRGHVASGATRKCVLNPLRVCSSHPGTRRYGQGRCGRARSSPNDNVPPPEAPWHRGGEPLGKASNGARLHWRRSSHPLPPRTRTARARRLRPRCKHRSCGLLPSHRWSFGLAALTIVLGVLLVLIRSALRGPGRVAGINNSSTEPMTR
jgi:hypothetical protein